MDADRRARIEANLFPAAHAAIGPWDEFAWHRHADLRHSSQALAIDLFGTLMTSPSRDAVLDALCTNLDLEPGGPWSVELEWDAARKVLGERRPTQVDAVFMGARTLFCIEAKFSERDGGACSQPDKLQTGPFKGQPQCNGDYAMQTSPTAEEGKENRCILTSKGIRYWEVIPQVMNISAGDDLSPCPFRGGWYQWMRNLVLCHQVARNRGLSPAVLVVYAEGTHLGIAEKVKGPEWDTLTAAIRDDAIYFGAMSYQEVLRIPRSMESLADAQTWELLAGWIDGKIEDAVRGR